MPRPYETSIREILRPQLLERVLGLLDAPQAHALEDPVGLRELHLAVIDELPAVAPRVAEVVRADDLDAARAQAAHGLLDVVDDKPDVAPVVGDVRHAAGEGDELVPHVHERHARAPAPELHAVEEAL